MGVLLNVSNSDEKMTNKKNVSGLQDHKLQKGTLVTPINNVIGKNLQFNSWVKERLPEYLWLGLILMYYGRKTGIEKARNILFEISKTNNNLLQPRFSKILCLPNNEQKVVYDIILQNVEKEVLAPLTILYPARQYNLFNEYFFIPYLLVEERLQIISEAIEIYAPHQSDETTDLRYLALSLMLFNNKVVIMKGVEQTAKALQEYPYTEHENEKMRLYRPAIRSMEIAMCLEENDVEFSSKFWKDLGMMTPCNPIKLVFPENNIDYNEFIIDCQKMLDYVFHSNKEKSLVEDKFDVIIGSINFAIKIFNEVNEKSLSNSILGRHAIRSIIEIYIMIKYLQKREDEHPNIWEEYKLYGISKYKLILLKARQNNNFDSTSHFIEPAIETIVNEIKWEEFIDIDLKYFDKQGIRDKCIDVGEKELYDLFYDYDSSFTHGLWGAIRESSMLRCDSANHQFHSIPDIYNDQNLPDVKTDSFKIILLLCSILNNLYQIPDWFSEKYLQKT